MKWRGRRASSNVDDRRRVGKVGGGIGVVGLIIGAVVVYMSGGDPISFLAQNAGNVEMSREVSSKEPSKRDDELKQFSSVVLADTEDVWNDVFRESQSDYPEPEMVLFRGAVQSACGRASSASGPFYCPADSKIYLDLSFFDELDRKLGAKGDFARAYVIVHEVGHHIQNVVGVNAKSREIQNRVGRREANAVSVTVELQADCLAGAWAKMADEAKSLLEEGDLEEALNAARAIGDDRLQRSSGREVNVDSFTHGSSEQRFNAFRLGYMEGNAQRCLSEYAVAAR